MRYFSLLIFCLFFFHAAVAQKKGQELYFKNSGMQTQKYSADYVLEILPPDTAISKKLYVIREFTTNGKLILAGTSITKNLPLKFQGSYITYFPSGHKMAIGNYEKGEPVGDEFDYYPNGKMYAIKSHTPDKKITLKRCLDSAGNMLADTGKGKWLEFDKSFKNHAEGNIDNGLKEGEWHGKVNDTVDFRAVYQKGDIVSSRFSDKSGAEHIFRDNAPADDAPQFKGGLQAFGMFLGRNINYPAEARQKGTQGYVVITFAIEKDGHLTNAKVESGIGDGCDEEALRCIRASPSWVPGYQYGVPVRTVYKTPISFWLSSPPGDVIHSDVIIRHR